LSTCQYGMLRKLVGKVRPGRLRKVLEIDPSKQAL